MRWAIWLIKYLFFFFWAFFIAGLLNPEYTKVELIIYALPTVIIMFAVDAMDRLDTILDKLNKK